MILAILGRLLECIIAESLIECIGLNALTEIFAGAGGPSNGPIQPNE